MWIRLLVRLDLAGMSREVVPKFDDLSRFARREAADTGNADW